MTTTVWITGAAGLIGSHLVRTAARLGIRCTVIPLTRADLDLTELSKVKTRFEADRPSLLIHCAAMTDTGECELKPSDARRINVGVTAHLAELFHGGRMVLFSTDLVFDGKKGGYVETDEPRPLSVYGETKLQAESITLTRPDNLVIRTSLNGGASPSGARSFNEVMENEWRAGRKVSLFADEFRSPIAAPVTARAAWELAMSKATGIHHVAGAERLSRHQIGQLVAARHPELKPRIEALSIKGFDGPPRPADCSLNCARAQSLLSFQLPRLSEWLESNSGDPF